MGNISDDIKKKASKKKDNPPSLSMSLANKSMQHIPEVAIYGVKPKPKEEVRISESKPKTYTPGGDGRWTYHGGADSWVNNLTGKIMKADDYEKKYPSQLRQAGYRKMHK